MYRYIPHPLDNFVATHSETRLAVCVSRSLNIMDYNSWLRGSECHCNANQRANLRQGRTKYKHLLCECDLQYLYYIWLTTILANSPGRQQNNAPSIYPSHTLRAVRISKFKRRAVSVANLSPHRQYNNESIPVKSVSPNEAVRSAAERMVLDLLKLDDAANVSSIEQYLSCSFLDRAKCSTVCFPSPSVISTPSLPLFYV